MHAGGIGTATGKALLRSKNTKLALLFSPFEAARVKPVISEVYNDAPEVRAYECDITSSDSVDNAFAAISKDDSGFPSTYLDAFTSSPTADTTFRGPLELRASSLSAFT